MVELLVGEERPEDDLGVWAADAVDTAVPLHQTHRVPRQVVVDDVAALLQVQALGQHVGCQQDVVLVPFLTGAGQRGSGRLGGKALDGLLAVDAVSRLVAGYRDDSVAVGGKTLVRLHSGQQERLHPVDGVLVEGEDEYLALPAPVVIVNAFLLGFLGDAGQLLHQRRQLRIVLRLDGLGLLTHLVEQVTVGLHVLPQRGDVVARRRFRLALLFHQFLDLVVIIRRRQLAHQFLVDDLLVAQSVQEEVVFLDHPARRLGEGVDGRLEPLQEPRANQADNGVVVVERLAAGGVVLRLVTGQGQLGNRWAGGIKAFSSRSRKPGNTLSRS